MANDEQVRDHFVGAWHLTSCTVTQADGTQVFPYGRRPNGIILYTPDGWMSCQLRGDDWAGDSKSDAAGPSGPIHYSSYYGSFAVDEEREVVIHHVAGSSEPTVHGNQERHYRFDGDSLILEAQTNGVTAQLEWHRAPPGPASA